MKTQSTNHKYFVYTLVIILIVFGVQGISYGQNLNVGEPRTVRMIYFLPNDRPYRPEIVRKMKDMIRTLQTFFADQMEVHGYGRKTFRIETDDKGEPKVHRVDGLHSDNYYLTNHRHWQEVDQKFDRSAYNVYFLVWDNSRNRVDSGVGGTGGGGKNWGNLTVPAIFDFGLVAHELAHAFGLGHDFRDGKYILSYGPGQNQLSACAAEYLEVHPYFNPNVPIERGVAPTIELISPPTFPAGSKSVKIQLKVSDTEGLQQVRLNAYAALYACRGLAGKKQAIVEFEYDGATSSHGFISLSSAVSHYMIAKAIDINGDTSGIVFALAESSSYHIHAFEEHTNIVNSLMFSPDGTKLVSGGAPVKLWDVATKRNIVNINGRNAVFSSDGNMLAYGLGNDVKLWDVATRNDIGTLEGHTGEVLSLAFSRDGTILASGAYDGSIKLWDVATRNNIGTFEEHKHTKGVLSLAFSPDGTMLASGAYDGSTKLWDVATRNNIASFKEDSVTAWIYSVAFSPDGTILASGRGNGRGNVKLWDVTAKRNIVTYHHIFGVTSVAFSPDGTIFASGSRDGIVTLRNVTTRKTIVELPHTSDVWSVAFSPDEKTFASGTFDGTVNLWDVTSFLSQESVGDTKKITISEIMVASNDGKLPQWIELYNHSHTQAVNIEGWTLEIQNRGTINFNKNLNVTITFKDFITFRNFKEKSIKPQETLLIVSKQGRSSDNLSKEQIYNLSILHPNLHQSNVLSEEGFYLKLSNSAREVIDEVGNLDGKISTNDKPAWRLPTSVTKEGVRTSMIRRHNNGTPLPGTTETGWVSAVYTKLSTNTSTYYGYLHDIGAPGIESGGALPVQLSRFRAERTEAGVILKWTTESELNNAGFNILRSETKNGKFMVVNAKLIQGAGTIGERNTYTWKDTTAKPNVVYYYRIEDVSYAGVRQQLTTVRLKGYVSASGKLTTRWADLKMQQ